MVRCVARFPAPDVALHRCIPVLPRCVRRSGHPTAAPYRGHTYLSHLFHQHIMIETLPSPTPLVGR